jgi:asparagine synthase (glutamine-hydrolysing)
VPRLLRMSGICGVVSASGSVDPERVAAMSATLVHRGPDTAGEVSDGTAALAVRGDQPLANEDETVHAVQDGAIYNYRELRRELERAGHSFRTHSDTEVLVHLYEEHGDAFAERLRGMFAVAIWDAPRRRLVLARDRFGIKPLSYREADGELAFASELRALPRGEIDLDAVEAFLAFNAIPAPLTIFKEARKLRAGHLLCWEDGAVRLERFAELAPLPERRDDRAELVEELRARLRDSVRAHLAGETPVGVLLSGGLDSALLAALAAEESSEPLHTFSIGFEEHSSDELACARRVAERYGTEHHELVLRPDASLLLPALAEAFDEPFADFSALPLYLVSELAASDVKVALSGQGGAELFGGHHGWKELLSPDRASMAHSLEVRVPYLDTVVTNLALALPTEQRAPRLREAAEPLLPREIVHGKKRGLSVPAAAWLRGELEPFARETLSAETLRRQGFFEPPVVQRLIDDHVAGREDLSRQLWGLLAFTLWHERHVEREPGCVRVPELLAER